MAFPSGQEFAMILFSLRDNCNYINSVVHFKNVHVRISKRNDDTGIHVTELEQGSSSGPFSCDCTKWKLNSFMSRNLIKGLVCGAVHTQNIAVSHSHLVSSHSFTSLLCHHGFEGAGPSLIAFRSCSGCALASVALHSLPPIPLWVIVALVHAWFHLKRFIYWHIPLCVMRSTQLASTK